VAVANLINIFDPALVLVGGEGLRAGDLLLEPLRATIPRHTFGRSAHEITLQVCPTDDVDWARGAASLVLRDVFRLPIYETADTPIIDTLLAQPIRGRGGEGGWSPRLSGWPEIGDTS
jgi:hypothetical protein